MATAMVAANANAVLLTHVLQTFRSASYLPRAPVELTAVNHTFNGNAGSQLANARATKNRRFGMAHTKSDAMMRCIDECQSCHSVCLEAVRHCLDKSGRHADPSHIATLLDCAEICTTSANFMLRGSEQHQSTCEVCAEVCDACATACDAFKDDDEMRRCAEECRRCAESCRAIAGSRTRA